MGRYVFLVLVILTGCAAQPPPSCVSPFCESDRTDTHYKCRTSDTESVEFDPQLPQPPACKDYVDRVNRIVSERAEMERQAQEIAERQKRKDAELAAFSESPVQSKEIFSRDLAVVDKLKPEQREALRDCAHIQDGVKLTWGEVLAIHLITSEQWHAISQLAAFAQWIDAKGKAAQGVVENEALEEANRKNAEEFRDWQVRMWGENDPMVNSPPDPIPQQDRVRAAVATETASWIAAWKLTAHEWLDWSEALKNSGPILAIPERKVIDNAVNEVIQEHPELANKP